jgi:asparagine synthase (glutamine-hydrolysing)
LFEYLYFHVIPSPLTVFRDVRRLPPAHCAERAGSEVRISPYWKPRFTHPSRPSFDSLKAEFLRLLEAAVARQLDGSKPGCFLSGGTDSSTVAGLIGKVTGKPAATYSIGFEAEGYDEMAYARIAAKRYGTEHHEYYVTPEDLIGSIPKVAAAYDQPFGNSSAVPAYHCAVMARSTGMTRILAGDGGDELFGGNSRYATQRVFGWYRQVPAPLRSLVLEPVFGLPLVGRTPLLKKGTGYIRQANTRLPDRLQNFNLLLRLDPERVLTPEFRALIDADRVNRHQREVWDDAESPHEIDLHLAFDWRYTLAEADLPKVRGTCELAGLEVGFPMLDDDLLAFSMRLPPEYKLKGAQLRWFFKEALRGFLPDEILRKKKQGFGLPFGVWMNRHARLKAFAMDAVEGAARRGIVNPAFVRELVDLRMPEHGSYYGTMVWILMMMEHWMRVHAPQYRLR